jgi:hypothetical protein
MNNPAYIEWNIDPAIIKGFPVGYYGLLFTGGLIGNTVESNTG